MEQIQQALREVGEWTGDASVGRGIVTVAGAAVAIGAGVWRLFRRRDAGRIEHRFSAPPGTKATFSIGDDEK
jgi:hypothetical protein